ncbi:MAG TPA: IS66 family transposase, partial [Pirellulales bacterium]|nr:IS66 family transposase [Pirellulales bacterium]
MSTDAAALPNDVTACHALIAQQFSTIDDLQHKLTQLEHYVAQLVRARFGPRSERLDPNQLTLFEAAAVEAIPPARDAVESSVEPHTRRGGGRNKLPDALPRERIEHDLAEHEKFCPSCGQLRQRIGCETSEQLEFIPAQLKVLEHVRWKYACRHCQEHVAIAEPPAKPIDRGLPGPGLLAQVAVGKFSDHLPLYRLEDVFARGGVELSRSTLCRWARCTAQLLEPLYRLIVDRVRRSHVIHTDDTPVSVLDPTLPKTRIGRFWVYCGDPPNPYSVYDYTASRKRDGPANFLKDYQGYLQADAFAGYDGIYAAGSVKQVLCWAHARRKFFEAKAVQPREAHPALAFIGRLYELEREAKSLSVESRRNLRQEQAVPVLAEFHIWLTALAGRVLPKSPVGQAIHYVLPRWEGLRRYCEDGTLAIYNNLAERTLRPCAIGRNYAEFRAMRRWSRMASSSCWVLLGTLTTSALSELRIILTASWFPSTIRRADHVRRLFLSPRGPPAPSETPYNCARIVSHLSPPSRSHPQHD